FSTTLTSTPSFFTLALHDALPISARPAPQGPASCPAPTGSLARIRSGHDVTAVGAEGLPDVEVAARIAGQQQDRWRHLRRRPEAAEGDVGELARPRFVVEPVEHPPGDGAGGDRVDQDVVVYDLAGECLREADDAGLRRRVVRRSGASLLPH